MATNSRSRLSSSTRAISTALAVSLPALAALAFAGPALAIDHTWNGSNGDWTVDTNWLPVGAPGAGDVAILNSGTATLNSFATIAGLNLGGGVLAGTGTLTLAGASTWDSGTVSAIAAFNGDLAISGATAKTVSGTVNANATTTWSGNTAANNNTLAGFGTFNNAGTFKDQNGFGSNLATATFNNSGSYQKISNTLTTVSSVFNNSGTVQVQAGTMQFNSNGTHTGSFDIAAGANLNFHGGFFVTLDNATFSGPGQLELSGAVVQFTNMATVANPLLLDGGTINGTASFSGPATWTAGTVGGAATAAFNGDLAISGATAKTVSGTVNANATTTWSGNTAANNNTLAGFGTFNNAGTFKDQNGFGSNLATATFNNSGSYQKISNTLTTVSSVFNNSGTVQVQAGTMQFNSNGTHTGSFDIAAGANLNFHGGFFVTLDNATFSGPGQLELSGAVVQFTNMATVANPLLLDGGTINGTASFSGPATWTAGTVGGAATAAFNGDLAISGATAKTVSGTVNANATTTWSGNTAANNNTLAGFGTFNNAGTFKDQNGFGSNLATATFNNSGSYQKISNTLTTVSSVFNNSGTVQVQAGTMQFNSNGTHTGSFDIAAGANLNFHGGFFVTLDNATFSGPGQLELSGAVVQFTNMATVANPLLLDGGTINGTASFSGPATWTAGTVGGAATAAFNGDLAISGATAKTVSGTVNANATTTWSGNTAANNNTLAGFGTFNNAGTFKDQNGFGSNLATATFNNSGSYQKISNTLTTVSSVFNNSGTVQVQAGTMQFNSNGTHTGSFDIAAGANLNFHGGFFVTLDNATFSGPGQLELSGAVVQFTNMATVANPLLLDGGTINGTASFSGPATWTAGTVGGAATAAFNGDLAISGATAKTVSGTVNANATTTWSGNTAANNNTLAGFGTFNNAGTFKDQNGFGSNLATATFNNSGSYQKISNTLTTVSSVFNNSGTVQVQAGTMKVNTTLTNQGLIAIEAAATFWNNSAAFTNGAAGTIRGNGTVQTAAGGFILNDGNIGPGNSVGRLDVAGDLHEGSTGVLTFELASLVSFDLLSVTGKALLGGGISVVNAGYVPVIGDSFKVMTFSDRAGTTFAGIGPVLHGFNPGVTFNVIYNAQDVTLQVASVPETAAWVTLLAGLAGVGAIVRRRPKVVNPTLH